MDRIFLKYVKDKKNIAFIAIALALGLILIFLGSGTDSEVVEVGVEDKISALCSSIEGVGECEVILYYSENASRGDERVESIIVICDGGDSVEVRSRLISMLSSFFGIGTNRIRVERRAK